MTLFNEATVFRKLGLANAAIASWEKVVEMDDRHVQGNYALFSYYLNAPGFAGGDTKKAESILQKLETIRPSYAELAHGMLSAKNALLAYSNKCIKGFINDGLKGQPHYSRDNTSQLPASSLLVTTRS